MMQQDNVTMEMQCQVELNEHVRVQSLTPWLFRVEQRGPEGFEDRPTFTVVNRAFPECPRPALTQTAGEVVATLPHAILKAPRAAKRIWDIEVSAPDGSWSHRFRRRDAVRSPLPAPSALPELWVMADSPRAVPPQWGALPAPAGSVDDESGWSIVECVRDFYVFLPRASGYEKFLADFTSLTGPVPLPPLYVFGLWYSRYHPYSEDSALAVMEQFRQRGFPLDVFVVDTDWRVGASCGYAINTDLFPDMARFIAKAHERGIKIVLNDHPEPVGPHALHPDELAYRKRGLDSLLDMGADAWWFDRNWHTHLQAPVEGLSKEVWGMRLYHDVTQAHRPKRRPLIMSNVDGVNNGRLDHPSHPAAHRYPIWWTGDTLSRWDHLQRGVQNAVNCAIDSLLPYVSEDLTGHIGDPNAEYVVRFMQFGVFSPIARIHSTCNTSRYPWQYGTEAERIIADYTLLRYRLIPVIYAAAWQAWKCGTPITRRCDLSWPEIPEARTDTQYLFGDDLLVAPIFEEATGTSARRGVWIPPGEWINAWNGEVFCGPGSIEVEASLEQIPLFIRRGGIVATLPQPLCTGEITWEHIILDLFPPSGDAEIRRHLYWDDGQSTRYQAGEGTLVELVFKRDGNELALDWISDVPPPRLTIRVRQDAHEQPLPVRLNGEIVDVADLEYRTVCPPNNQKSKAMFVF